MCVKRPDPPVEPNGPGLATTRSAGRVVTKMTLSESRGLSPDNLWTTLMDDFCCGLDSFHGRCIRRRSRVG
jgi:hypothetical protein